jgi:outer membrane immunogenic protein
MAVVFQVEDGTMKLKSALLASATGLVAAPVANAADLPVKAMPSYIPVASWAGWYAGLHAGAAWQNGRVISPNFNEGTDKGSSQTAFIGGGQLGYNWQQGYFVYGWEADISGLTTDTRGASNGNDGRYGANISWLSTIRGRMGLAIADTMVYWTGGLAIGGVKNTYSNGTGPDRDYSNSRTRVGWAVGGGIEHMWNRNFTIALEGLFVDLGRYTGTCHDGKCSQFSNQAMIGRLKVNYKF